MQLIPMTLAGRWQVVERPLEDGPEKLHEVMDALPMALACEVPGDVSDCLVRAGRMPEPLIGLNYQQFDWIDNRSWWLTRQVDVPHAWADLEQVQLLLDGLDYGADIWLNGHYLGQHHSAFYPFTRDVKALLQFGSSNILWVRLTTGRDLAEPFKDYPFCEAVPTEAGRGHPERGLRHRIFLRKPAYTWGWDWGPYLATCGITGQALLKPIQTIHITDVSAVTQLHGTDAMIDVCVEVEHHTCFTSKRADVTVTLTDADGLNFNCAKRDVPLNSGINYVDLQIAIPKARLWWPNGSGPAHRYQVQTRVHVEGVCTVEHRMAYGVRTVAMVDQPGHFAFEINGQSIFIKGGNWIPSDSLYGRITDEKLRALVQDAGQAHFNCLRIWGGGRYEAEAFYEACDEQGILLWHDFMSACAPLPADQDWFYKAFEQEAVYQIKRLRSRACMLLWCGNNEVAACCSNSWFVEKFKGANEPGWALYHRLLPALTRQLCPHLPYRPTSPYSGASTIDDHHEGDCHHWMVMRPESKYWSNPWYWDTDDVPIFNSEYGYGGPCSLQSTRQYTGSNTPDLFDATGYQHTNTFYDIPRVNFSIAEHYRDAENLPLEQYILLGGLSQGLNLGYSLESMRANPHTMGGMFWMYNDTWGENGWSIIDYYLRRKISWYNVRRCLSHQRLLLRKGGEVFGGKPDEVLLLAINDGPAPLNVTCEWGYMSHDGQTQKLIPLQATVMPHSHTVIGTMFMPSEAMLQMGTVVVIPTAPADLEPASWLYAPYKQWHLPAASLRIANIKSLEDGLHITVASDVYAHAVHLNVPDDCNLSDHFYDLFAGMSRTVVIANPQAVDIQNLRASCVSWA